jgi:hypothetical protein
MSHAKRIVLSYATRLMLKKQYGKIITCSGTNNLPDRKNLSKTSNIENSNKTIEQTKVN